MKKMIEILNIPLNTIAQLILFKIIKYYSHYMPALFFSLGISRSFIFRFLASTKPSFLYSDKSRMTVSVAVPTKLPRSSREIFNLRVPSSSIPKSFAIMSNISANRSLTDFWAMSLI